VPDAVAKKNATKTRGGSIKNTRAPLEKREVKDKQLGLRGLGRRGHGGSRRVAGIETIRSLPFANLMMRAPSSTL
jgi:hypothetical protein